MSFVGIIADSIDFEFIKNEIINKKNCSKLELINLNKDNIENMRNVKFEVIVFGTDMIKMKNEKSIIDRIIKDTKYLLINSDFYTLTGEFENNQIQIITYGMGQKATVTASSIKEDEVMVCLQRNIENISGNIIEMQEFKVNVDNMTNDKVYNLLVVFVLEQLYA